MTTRLTTFERDKFEEINDEIVIDVAIISGAEMAIDPTRRTTTLEKEKFIMVDGKTAVRVNVVSGAVGTLDADAIVTASVGRDSVRTKTGNVISIRFED